jgi:protein phosphatase
MATHPLKLVLATHTGLVRHCNQDYIKGDAELGVAVLADGMGGHRGGEVASRVAVESAFEALVESQRESQSDETRTQMRVGQAVETANRALFDMTETHPELAGMGTTLVAAVFREQQIFFGHVGDSRLYRVRMGRLRRLTHDHSLIQRLVDNGLFVNRAEARRAGIRDNILTRSLGMQQDAEIDLGVQRIEAGDTFLFCSDGLHNCVPDSLIAKILRDPAGDLDRQVIELIDAAMAEGAPDNVSVILARPRVD